MQSLLEFLRHPDVVLADVLNQYGNWAYALLFLVVFIETGVVVFPFLPGDSLLFAVGALAADPRFNLSPPVLYVLFIAAALTGDNCNYWIGRKFGRNLFKSETSKVFNRAHLARTEEFFAKFGPRAIILARFVPFIRTFAPFVAGMGEMNYLRFLVFSIVGAIFWVGLCVTAGLMFGNMGWVKQNFEKLVLGIILVSLIPVAIEFLKHRQDAKKGVESVPVTGETDEKPTIGLKPMATRRDRKTKSGK